VVAFEDGFLPGPLPRCVQRIVAVREPAAGLGPTLNSAVREDSA
jgi:hypothetical protein